MDEMKYKGYLFDSLVFRFKEYQHKAFSMDVSDVKYKLQCSELEARRTVQDRHDRDLMRFIAILNEAMGEHD